MSLSPSPLSNSGALIASAATAILKTHCHPLDGVSVWTCHQRNARQRSGLLLSRFWAFREFTRLANIALRRSFSSSGEILFSQLITDGPYGRVAILKLFTIQHTAFQFRR